MPGPKPVNGGAALAPLAAEAKPAAGPVIDAEDPRRPSFDLVRVEKGGSALVAGRALPLSTVRILSDGMEIARARSGPSGEFVAMLPSVAKAASQVLSLDATAADGESFSSAAPVIVLGREMPEAMPAPGEDRTAETVAILRATEDAVEIVQPVRLEAPDRVTLDQIAYGEAAEVVLVGRGVPGRIARIYVDDAPRAEAHIDDAGRWRAALPDLPEGIYTLRIDEIDAAGKVASRSESPFKRERPDAATLARLEDASRIVIQPGNNLWTIARLRYGQGIRYHVIFDANRDQIRDPDLIYPGQVFALPEAVH